MAKKKVTRRVKSKNVSKAESVTPSGRGPNSSRGGNSPRIPDSAWVNERVQMLLESPMLVSANDPEWFRKQIRECKSDAEEYERGGYRDMAAKCRGWVAVYEIVLAYIRINITFDV